MAAAKYNLYVEQGTTFSKTITWKDSVGNPIDLTGYSAELQIRASVESTTTFLSLTSTAGITLQPAGLISILITPAQTRTINARKGIYDLELTAPGGTVRRLLEGKVTFSPEVTR